MCCGKDTRKRACGCFFTTSPRLAGQAQPDVFIIHVEQSQMQGHFVEQNKRWVLKSRASLLVKGLENSEQLGLSKHTPAAVSVYIRVIRG
jgi:hypothetical protein